MTETWNGVADSLFFRFSFNNFETKMFGWMPRGTHPPNYESRLWPVFCPQRNTNFPLPVFSRIICIELRFFAWNTFSNSNRQWNRIEDTQSEIESNWEQGNERKIKVLEFQKVYLSWKRIYWILSEWINWKCNIGTVRSARLCTNASFFNFLYIFRCSFGVCVCVVFLWLFTRTKSLFNAFENCDWRFARHILFLLCAILFIRRHLEFRKKQSFHRIAPTHSIFIVTMMPCPFIVPMNSNKTNNLFSLFGIFLQSRKRGIFCSHFCFHIENFHFICLKHRCFWFFDKWTNYIMNTLNAGPSFLPFIIRRK